MKRWTPVVAGLAAAAVMALVARPHFPPESLLLRLLFLAAAMYVVAVFVASTLALLITQFIQALRGNFHQMDLLRTGAAAAWVGPLLLLLFGRSPWAMVASVVLVASIAGLWDKMEPGDTRRFASAMCASLCLQIAMMAAMTSHSRWAAMMAGVGTAALMWTRPEHRPTRFTFPRVLPRIALAIVFTVIALAPYLESGSGNDDAGEAAGQAGGSERSRQSKAQALGAGEFPGVILWPEESSHTMLVPPPPSMGRGRGLGSREKPLTIPFYGAYWFFRWPDKRPPPNSVVAHGSTVNIVYRSIDHMALTMEAHQNFGALLDLSCCKSIEVVIFNEDPLSDGIRLELVLANTELEGKPSLSLGRMPVSTAFEETLSFPVPASSNLRQFDEATVRFHRGYRQSEWEKSSKIAIERFVLVP